MAWEEKIDVDLSKEQLERKNLEEYIRKLNLSVGTIPDPFSLSTGWIDEKAMEFWPSLYFEDMCDCFRMKTPTELYDRLVNEYKEGKGYRYYTSGWVKEVLYNNIDDHSSVCLFATKVTPSMSIRSPPYQVWAAVEKDTTTKHGGKIHAAYCTCTAGLGGCCNHIVGMLFRIQAAVAEGLTHPSCTSKACEWKKPKRFEPQKPIKICQVPWKKEKYFQTSSDDYYESVLERSMNYSSMSATDEEHIEKNMETKLGHELRNLVPNSCFIQMLESKPMPKEDTVVCPESLMSIATAQAKRNNSDVSMLLAALSMDEKSISDIEAATRKQNKSDDWHEQRMGRITASDFARVSSKVRNITNNPDTTRLVKHISSKQTTAPTKAIKHGKAMEPIAKLVYKR